MASLLLALRIATQLAAQAARIAHDALVDVPMQVWIFTTAFWGTLFSWLWSVFSNRRLALGLGVALVLLFGIGRLGSEHTSVLLKAADVTNECFVREVAELANKAFFLPVQRIYETVAAFVNVFLHYALFCLWEALETLVEWARLLLTKPFVRFDDLFASGFWDLLQLPAILWEAVKCLAFFWTVPHVSRAEPFAGVVSGITSAPRSVYTTGSGASEATFTVGYEFPPRYGAFYTQPSHVRDLFVDAWNLARCAGDVVFETVADLSDLRGRFFPSLLAHPRQAGSFWGRLCECVGRFLSFITATWAAPYDTGTPGACCTSNECLYVTNAAQCTLIEAGAVFTEDGRCGNVCAEEKSTGACCTAFTCYEPTNAAVCAALGGTFGGNNTRCADECDGAARVDRSLIVGFSSVRAKMERVIFRIVYNLCCYLRFVWLIVNEVTTAADNAVPVYDLVATYLRWVDGDPVSDAELNINLFKRKAQFCVISAQMPLSFEAGPPRIYNSACTALLAGNAGRYGATETGGTALCSVWSGFTVQGGLPAGVVIDYVCEFKKCLLESAFILLDPLQLDADPEITCTGATLSCDPTASGLKNGVLIFVRLLCALLDLVYAIVYAALTAFTPGCEADISPIIGYVFTDVLPGLVTRVVEIFFGRCCCPTHNFFYCALEFSSQDFGSIFEVVCELFDDLPVPDLEPGAVEMHCEACERNRCDGICVGGKKRDIGGGLRDDDGVPWILRDEARFIAEYVRHQDADEPPPELEAELRRMLWASDGRKLLHSVAACYTDANSTFRRCEAEADAGASCALRALECTQRTVNADNVWLTVDNPLPAWAAAFYDDAHSSGTSTLEAAKLAGLFAYDTYKRVGVLVESVVPAYAECMAKATEAGTHRDATLAYVRCLTRNDTWTSEESGAEATWTTFLAHQGVRAHYSTCTRSLTSAGGLLVDRVGENVDATPELGDVTYRLCAFLHAAATRVSVLSNGTKAVEPFLDMWTAPVELMRAASFVSTRADDADATAAFTRWRRPNVTSPYRTLLDTLSASMRTAANSSAYEATMARVRLIGVVMEHYADVYDRVVDGDGTATVAPADARKREAELVALNEHLDSTLLRAVKRDAPSARRRRALPPSAYWTERWSATTAKNDSDDAEPGVAEASDDGVLVEYAFDDTERVPFLLHVGARVSAEQRPGAHDYRRVVAVPSLGGGDAYRRNASTHLWRAYKPWKRFALPTVRNALRAFQQAERDRRRHQHRHRAVVDTETAVAHLSAAEHASQMQDAAHALTLINQLEHHELDARERYVARVDGDAAVLYDTLYVRQLVRTLFRIVDRRARLSSLPPVQAAHAFWDALSAGSHDDMSRWLSGDAGYIVGTGFVEAPTYAYYMAAEAEARSRHLAVFSPLAVPAYRRVPVLGYAWLLRQKARLHESAAAAAATTTSTRRHAHWTRRSRFLARHGLHDEHVWAFAGNATQRMWQRRSGLGAAANATTTRVEHGLAIGQNTNDALYAAWDSLLSSFFGAQASTVTDSVGALDAFWTGTILPLFSSARARVDELFVRFVDSIVCDVPNDFALGGTGTYKLGCLPFWPERLLSFYGQFPSNAHTGIIPWAADIVKEECALPRVPDCLEGDTCVFGQCAAPAPFPLSTFNDEFAGYCLTDMCTVYASGPGTQMPLCDTCPFGAVGCIVNSCDYCERDYYECAELGYTDGLIVLQTWLAAVKALWAEIWDVNNSALGVVTLFLLVAFADFNPLGGAGLAYFVVFTVWSFQVYFGDPADFLATSVFLFVLWHVLPLAALIAWGLMTASYALLAAGIAFAPSTLIVDAAFALNPQRLLHDVLVAARDSFFLRTILMIDTDALLTPLVDRLDRFVFAAGDPGPTNAELLCSVLTAYNFVELVLLGFLFAAFALYAAGVAAIALRLLVNVLVNIAQLRFRIDQLLLDSRVDRLAADVELSGQDATYSLRAIEDDVDEEVRRLRRDVDELRAAGRLHSHAPAAAALPHRPALRERRRPSEKRE